MFMVQDGSCSDGGSGTPLSDRASLVCLDFQNLDSPEQDQDQDPEQQKSQAGRLKEEAESRSVAEQATQSRAVIMTSLLTLSSCPSCLLPPGSLLLQENQLALRQAADPAAGAEVVPLTPNVDLLLECTFAYMHRSEEEDGQEQQPLEEPEDEFLSPLIGPDEEEEEDKDEVG